MVAAPIISMTYSDLLYMNLSFWEYPGNIIFLLLHTTEIDNLSLVWSAVIALYHQPGLVT
ncbi:MAG TPA: hypothetical protein DCX09_04385 [Gammaproteobacteria bacterium]|nr:hypothetical protein [Gammaproteobacteria bacterium]